ncbi:MAG: hypothetical protein KDE50_06850 [Caldilineaceae bacterium]|nr:hypothetical protein [Caldilineaceae bacterium]
MVRNTLAVLVGFSVWAALFIGSISLLFKSASNSPNMAELNNEPGMLIFLILLGLIYAVIAGLITARTANISPTIPTLILGLTLLIASLAAQIRFWEMLPVWYHLSFLLLLIPGVFMGAILQTT